MKNLTTPQGLNVTEVCATLNDRTVLISVEAIGPEKAADYLTRNLRNRRPKLAKIRQYARDMETSKWTACPAAIAFYEDNVLADGQNRLQAIINSQTEQDFLVIRGLTTADGQNIDMNTPRSATDVAHISGFNDDVNRELLAVARGIEYGESGIGSKTQISGRERLELFEKYDEAVKWVMEHMPKTQTNRHTCNSATRAAVGRAFLAGVDRIKLARFCEVFTTGFMSNPQESAAIALRNVLLDMRARNIPPTGHMTFRSTFMKTMNAVRYFVSGMPLAMIKGTTTEAYPLNGAMKPVPVPKPPKAPVVFTDRRTSPPRFHSPERRMSQGAQA
jgi:hypothetical protein